MKQQKSCSLALSSFVLASIAACNSPTQDSVDQSASAQPFTNVNAELVQNHTPPSSPMEFELAPQQDVDVLFIVDDSSSMVSLQAKLADSIGSFIDVLESKEVSANYRIGVANSNMGLLPSVLGCGRANARELRYESCLDRADDFVSIVGDSSRFNSNCKSKCKLTSSELETLQTAVEGDDTLRSRPWVERIDGVTNLKNQDLDPRDVLACVLPQGLQGCAFENPLGAMAQVLRTSDKPVETKTKRLNMNAGFMRDQATLAVIHVTDELDCSFNHRNQALFEDQLLRDIFRSSEKDVFKLEGQVMPTSAACMLAGVSCEGEKDGYYESCQNVDLSVEESPLDANEALTQAVLTPVHKIAQDLESIRSRKRKVNPNSDVFVGLIGGVPRSNQPIRYASGKPGTPTEWSGYMAFGMGPGCEGTHDHLKEEGVPGHDPQPAGQDKVYAMAPVRLHEVIRTVNPPGQSALASICENDWNPNMQKLAQSIAAQMRPLCAPSGVADLDPSTEILDTQCTVKERRDDQESVEIPECLRIWNRPHAPYRRDPDSGAYVQPKGHNSCYRKLVDKTGDMTPDDGDDLSPVCGARGTTLEFRIERRTDAPADPKLRWHASCKSAPGCGNKV